jgi:MFS family permease
VEHGTTDPAEGAFETPVIARGEALPSGTFTPFARGPFRLLVFSHGLAGLAFWGFFGTVFAQAAYRYHADASGMAVLGASLSIPFIFGSLVQGLVVDRWSPKWITVIGYVAGAAAILLAWFGGSLLALYASTVVVGAAVGTVEPSRSALTALLVPEDRLVQANGTLAVAFQISLAVGPLASGWLLHTRGAGAVYAVALAIAVVPPFLAAAIPDLRQRGETPSVSLADLRAGASTIRRHDELRLLLVVTALGWTLINVFFVLEPLFVRGTLHRGGDALLYLWGAHGVGAFLGSIALIRTRRARGKEAMIVCTGVTAIGIGIAAYAGAGIYGVSIVSASVTGVGFAMLFPPLFALIQRVVPEEQRGRVTSVFVSCQEAMGLASSFAIFVLGGLVVVRPTLVGSGGVIAFCGFIGLQGLRRSRDRAAA